MFKATQQHNLTPRLWIPFFISGRCAGQSYFIKRSHSASSSTSSKVKGQRVNKDDLS